MTNDPRRLRRRIIMLYLVTGGLYLLLGFCGALQAQAQMRAQHVIHTQPIVTPVPTGSDDATVDAYYQYLHLRTLGHLQQTYFWNPIVFGWIYGSIGVLLILFYFFMFAWYARLGRGDLYPVEVYNGYIAERGGPVDPFDWALWSVLVTYAAYYIVVDLIFGQYY